jgi:hypothetical protein
MRQSSMDGFSTAGQMLQALRQRRLSCAPCTHHVDPILPSCKTRVAAGGKRLHAHHGGER